MSESKKGVPEEFYSSKCDHVICETVADVIEQLKRLPPELPVNQGFETGVCIVVYNISNEPHLEFEEAND